jgi:hypothetical protein
VGKGKGKEIEMGGRGTVSGNGKFKRWMRMGAKWFVISLAMFDLIYRILFPQDRSCCACVAVPSENGEECPEMETTYQ